MANNRYLTTPVMEDLRDKMAFIGGPRQVGKTTLARDLVGSHFRKTAYFNWDNKQDRRRLTASEWPADAQLLIFDEIHKYRPWKRFVKGEFDTHRDKYRFIVTGSARLDIYRKGGDSLQGRYHYYRLHPFSVAELEHPAAPAFVPFRELPIGAAGKGTFALLEKMGGFPEPLFGGSERVLRRWHNERSERLFREDIRDIEMIRDLGNMQLLSDMLPSKVGSLLSANSLREDLEVSHRAVSRWLDILERFYYHFRIRPFARNKIRSIRKEPKLYLWDWSEVANDAARYENMVASHLLKLVHWLKDREGFRADLYFLRDTSMREVDFLVTVDEKAWFAVEVKSQSEHLAPNLPYFRDRLAIPFSYQLVKKPGIDKIADGVRILSADKFLAALI
ncbi:MAG: ATP-binding protein [Candidatus Liptonbacteria bacterium]